MRVFEWQRSSSRASWEPGYVSPCPTHDQSMPLVPLVTSSPLTMVRCMLGFRRTTPSPVFTPITMAFGKCAGSSEEGARFETRRHQAQTGFQASALCMPQWHAGLLASEGESFGSRPGLDIELIAIKAKDLLIHLAKPEPCTPLTR